MDPMRPSRISRLVLKFSTFSFTQNLDLWKNAKSCVLSADRSPSDTLSASRLITRAPGYRAEGFNRKLSRAYCLKPPFRVIRSCYYFSHLSIYHPSHDFMAVSNRNPFTAH